jgi:hypothetical protein
MKAQRTGLTEGSLIFNEWLKSKGLYRLDTEGEFINWLYSTSGFYDSEISGTNFDIDVEAVKNSIVYQRFLREFHDSLLDSDIVHLMIHGSYHLNGQEKQAEFASRFAPVNTCFWKDVPYLQSITEDKRVLVVSSIAELVEEKYGVIGYTTPTTHLNTGPDKNYFETLDRVMSELPMDFDFALISFGAYGVLMADRLVKMGKSAATIGSGIYDLYPVGEIPVKYRPKGYEKIEGGRYWLQK